MKINTPIEWEDAWRAGKIPKNLPTQPGTYYQRKRGIAKNVENEFYTSWFKFSGTSSKWTEEVGQYAVEQLAKELKDANLLDDKGYDVEESLTMILVSNDVLKNPKHKAEFADMLTRIAKGKLSLDEINVKGKVRGVLILFYVLHFF